MRRTLRILTSVLLPLLGSCAETPTGGRTPSDATRQITAPAEEFATRKEIKSVGLCCDTRLFIGQYTQPKITVTYTDNSTETRTGQPTGWVSSNPSVAGIADAGQIRGNAQGTALVTVYVGTVASNSIFVNVVPAPVVSSVQVTPTPVTLSVGNTKQLSARILDQYSQVMTGKTVAWSTDHPTVAAVSSAGVIHGVAAGTTTVRAMVDGVSGSATVTVYPPSPPVSVTLAGPDYIQQEGLHTWTANPSGGSGSYTYQWAIIPAYSGSPTQHISGGTSVNTYVAGSTEPFIVRVTVTSNGMTDIAEKSVCNFIQAALC